MEFKERTAPPSPPHPLLLPYLESLEARNASVRQPSSGTFDVLKSRHSYMKSTFVGLRARSFMCVLTPFLMFLSYTVVVVVLCETYAVQIPEETFSSSEFDYAVTVTLSLLLVFRLSRAAVRWWDSRTLYGAVIGITRNLATRVAAESAQEEPSQEVVEFFGTLMVFACSLRAYLRKETVLESDLAGIADAKTVAKLNASSHKFLTALHMTRRSLNYAIGRGTRSQDLCLDACMGLIDQMGMSAGGLERINNTPLPMVYVAHLRTFLSLYLLYLPWTLIPTLHYYAIIACGISSFVLLGVEGAASDVDGGAFKPDKPNHLDVDGLTLAIYSNVYTVMEEYVAGSEEFK
mmetsp:Transcript_26205/g.52246  ORF Transcript_26205/g.52246 Transcript_26205/m.52246 type:complete len:348 (+) Transcript_26205:119-1162(+)